MTWPMFLALKGDDFEDGEAEMVSVDIIERIYMRGGKTFCITRFDDEPIELAAPFALLAQRLNWP